MRDPARQNENPNGCIPMQNVTVRIFLLWWQGSCACIDFSHIRYTPAQYPKYRQSNHGACHLEEILNRIQTQQIQHFLDDEPTFGKAVVTQKHLATGEEGGLGVALMSVMVVDSRPQM